jgi:glycosyltransferase involved in cell wall biosynthesis
LKPVVLQLIDSFHQGGSERQALQLTRLLHDSGQFQLRLACLSPDGMLRREIEDLNLGEIPAFPLDSFYDRNAFIQLRRFASHLRAAKVDILHTHDFYTNIFGMTAGALARVPVRVSSRRETSGMRSTAQTKTQGFAYALAHRVVANSEAVRRQLVTEGVRAEKIAVIYNGLDLDRVASPPTLTREEALAALGLPPELQQRHLVTIVANMRLAVKDYPLFLRAARRVRAAVPAAAFLLAGEGELSESIKAAAKELELDQDAFFLGRCEQLAELFAISAVCVLSSQAEGFSNSILEYMAAALPVVATDVGGACEAIVEGETGYLVPAGDDQLMADRIISLLHEPERARAMGEAGRRIVAQKFSCAAQLERTGELYDALLNRGRVIKPIEVEQATRDSA